MPEKTVVNWLKKQMATPHIEKVMHNALYDLGWMRWAGIEVQGPIIDTMIAAPLINENRRFYNLELLWLVNIWPRTRTRRCYALRQQCMVSIQSQVCGDYQLGSLVSTPSKMRLLPFVCGIGCVQRSSRKKYLRSFKLETDLLPVLFEMKTRGVRVDIDKAEQVKKDLKRREDLLLKEIKEETGIFVEPWVATSIAKAFDAIGVSYSRTENSKRSVLYKTVSVESHASNSAEDCKASRV
jgi:DNA polymerase I-like protein with 3'-5' exonuclease and polymerase domains